MNAAGIVRRAAHRDALWIWYLGAGAILAALYALVPPFQGSGPVINLLGLSSSVAIALAVRRYRPPAARAWWLFAIGQFLFFAGDLYTYSYPKLFGADVPFPSPGDVAYLAVYPALLAGLVILIRSRNGSDRGGVIDAVIITLGFALLSWVFLIVPYGTMSGLTVVAKGVSMAYPIGDMMLLAGLIRLAVDSGRRPMAFRLLVGSIVCLLWTDSIYTYTLLNDTYNGQIALDIGWISYYLLWGAAALHPSMSQLGQRVRPRVTRLTHRRLALLAAACMIAPSIRFVQNLHHLDVAVIQLAAAALFLLVLARMVGLVRQEERSVVLRTAGVELVGAASREQILRAAGAAVSALTAAQSETRLLLLGDRPLVVGGEPLVHATRETTADWLAHHAAVQTEIALSDVPHEVAVDLDLEVQGYVLLGQLEARGAAQGVLVIATDLPVAADAREALDALAAQVALALDGAERAEDAARRQSEARFRSLVAHSTDLITVIDDGGDVAYQSPSSEFVLGRRAEELAGRSFLELVRDNDRARVGQLIDTAAQWHGERRVLECELTHANGSSRHFEVQLTNLLGDPDVAGIVLNSRDVSEQRAFEQQLSHQAFHDPVTGLANRALFADRVAHALNRRSGNGTTTGLMFIDLDDFKTVNDSLGHAAGDDLLKEVGRRLIATVRPNDTVARFGGDEFAILLEDVPGVQLAADMAERVLAALELPFEVGSNETYPRASVGICLADPEALETDANDLLRNADVAMYMAKRNDKGSYRLFEPAMHERVLERLELRADLEHAIADGQLELYYQPVMRLKDDAVYGVEALLRWKHPVRGQISPAQFIPLAEDTGLIIPIGRWVLQQACREATRIDATMGAGKPIMMSVNLSVRQLQDEAILADVQAALEASGLEPSRLVLEITESVMIADAELAIQRLQALKQLGVRLAMDDFGTGYSSLSYLSRFPVDILKMDRSFLSSDRVDSGLAAAIVGLGETLQVDVVAEGIELTTQTDSLRQLGCKLGQGFLYARPMPSHDLVDYLAKAQAADDIPEAA